MLICHSFISYFERMTKNKNDFKSITTLLRLSIIDINIFISMFSFQRSDTTDDGYKIPCLLLCNLETLVRYIIFKFYSDFYRKFIYFKIVLF